MLLRTGGGSEPGAVTPGSDRRVEGMSAGPSVEAVSVQVADRRWVEPEDGDAVDGGADHVESRTRRERELLHRERTRDHQLRDSTGETTRRWWHRATELPNPVRALRAVQRASYNANAALARRMGLGVSDVAAREHPSLRPTRWSGRGRSASRHGWRGAAALVDRLDCAGHVSRSPHPRDRRRQVRDVTPGSRAQTWAALQPLLMDLAAAADRLTPAEADPVVRFRAAAAPAMERHTRF